MQFMNCFLSSCRKAVNGDYALTVLPMPENVHWMGETALATWADVPEARVGNEVQFLLRLYRRDTASAPDPESTDRYYEELYRVGNGYADQDVHSRSMVTAPAKNGFYYFTLSAVGDGIQYADSPYAVSDVFEYTGEDAPPLPAPGGLAWRLVEESDDRYYLFAEYFFCLDTPPA